MKSFIDSANRTWTINLTIDSVKRVKSFLDVDLLNITSGDPPLLTRLGTDIMLLCDVIFVLVKPQADKLEVTDEAFGSALGGEVIFAAQSAFFDELVDFFRGMGRKDIMKALTTQSIVINRTVERVTAKIDAMDLDKIMDKIMAESETTGGLSTS